MNSPTMREIAKAAGVNVATVSKALRNGPTISLETRARIQKIAEDLGYRVDAQISRHMSYVRRERSAKETLPLALVYGFKQREHLELPQSREERIVFAAARERAETLGYHLDLYWLHDPAVPPERLRRILRARGCGGIIFWSCVVKELPLDLTGFATVSLGPGIQSPLLHSVMSDSWGQTEMVFQEVLRLGYRRFGVAIFATELERVHPTESRYHHGVLTGEIVDPIPCFKSSGYERKPFLEWVAQHRPDAIWASSRGAGTWLTQAGYKIPEEIAFASFIDPRLDTDSSGVDRHVAYHARTAIDILVGQIHRNESGVPDVPQKITIKGRWVDGKTLPKAVH